MLGFIFIQCSGPVSIGNVCLDKRTQKDSERGRERKKERDTERTCVREKMCLCEKEREEERLRRFL